MAAAELKLQVGLDLAFFRQQLAQIGSVAVGYQLPINIKLDRLSIQQELDRLQRNINRRKYTIQLNDNSVVSAADKVENLAAALKKLSGSIQIDFNAGGGTKSIGTAMKEMAAKLAKESKGDINEAVNKMTQMRGAAPFGAGTRSVPGFKAAAKGMGVENAFKLFFQELDRVDPQRLRKALDDGSVMMMQENREIKQKFDKIQSSAEGLAKDLRAMGEAAQATGRASLSDGGKTLYPQNYGLKIASLLGQIEKLEKELRKVSAESGVELLDNLKELSYALRATSNSFVGIAGFSDTLDATLKGFNTATQAAARATNAYTERIRRRGGIEYGPVPQRLLPSSPPIAGFLPRPRLSPQEREAAARARRNVELGPRTAGEARPLITEDPRVVGFRQLLEQRDERDKAAFAEFTQLRDAALKKLPAGTVAEIGTTAQDQIVRNFYNALREGTIRIRKATQQLLTGTQLSGLLPSREMVDQRKFAAAIQQAAVIDMQNALQFQMQKKMLPAAGETAFAANVRQSLQGSVFRAPATSGRGDATREELQERKRSARAVQARRKSEERSAQVLEADDRRRASIRALLNAEAAQELRDASLRRQLSRENAERMLPAGIPAIASQSAQNAVVEQFYASMKAAQQMLERYFSANSYLPQSTRALAASMMQASASIKALPAARGAIGALPSAEMMAPLKVPRALAKAARIDMENALRQQMQKKMLPAAGQTSYRSPEQIANERQAANNARQQARARIVEVRRQMAQPLLPATGETSAPRAAKGINTLITAIGDLGSKAASTAGKIQGKVKSSLQKASDFITMSSDGDRLSDISPEHRKLRFSDFHNFGMKSNAPLPMAGAMGQVSPPKNTQSPYQPLSAGRITAQSSMFATSPAPPGPPGPPTPPTPPGGGRGGFGSFGSFRGAMPNVSLPGAGLVKEVGDQFGYAAQQVLLFGTTYKALAFLTDFPSKVGEAVAQLQTFRNTLQAITPNADEFQKSNQFILDTVDKYNTPLQSARDGFTNLYASMAPAGFKGDEIRNIFAGISQGAATFGMSADKVDRVNYAFAQMASKGQVMSEELKGQLGDVLPGAVAIFAQAAGFKGPQAMVEFTKAMEAGRYKGEAMKQLLINVGIVMKDKFAKGAEGAAQNFQGQMNAMGNATKKLYEAFEPAGNLFASKVIAPFTSGLQVLTDGFNAFFTGAATKTAGGFALSQELEKLRPTFKGLSENVKQFLPLLQSFATTALGLSKILLQIASNPFVGYMARVYAIVLPLNIALSVMRGLWASNAIQLLVFNARVASGTSMLTAFRSMMATTGATSAATAAVIRGAFATTGIGAILVGLGLLIEHFVKMNQALDESRTKALGASDAIRGMSQTELQLKQNELGRQEVLVRGLQGKNKGEKYKLLTAEEEKMVRELSPDSITNVFRPRSSSGKAGKLTPSVIGGQPGIDISILESLNQKIQSQQQIVDSTRATLKAQDRSANLVLAPIPSAGGVDKAAASALASRQALADKLSADQTKTDIERQKTLFENEKSMINMAYDLREARANSFQKETIRFQRELFNIEMERQKAVLDANSAVTKAQGAVAGGTGMAGLTQYITGDPSQKGYQADHGTIKNYHDHLAFTTRKAAEDAYKKLVAEGIKVTEFKGYGQGVTGPHSGPGSLHHQGLAMDVPGYQWKGTGTIGAKEYAGSARVRQVLGIEGQASAGGKPTGRQKRVALADQQTQNALQDTKVKITLAEVQALKKAEIATENYVASIMPVAEQELQNKLSQRRLELMRTGIRPDQIDTEMKIYEAQQKQTIGIQEAQKEIERVTKLKNEHKMSSEDAAKAIANEQKVIDDLTNQLDPYTKAVREAALANKDLAVQAALTDLENRAQMARALTPEAEMRTRLQQQGYAGTQLETLFETEKATAKAEQLKTQMQGVASTIGDAFSTAFQGIINGSMSAQDALAGMFQSIGQSFVKMAMDMIAQQITMITLGFIMKALGLLSSTASTALPGSAPQMTPNAIVTPTGFQGMFPPNLAAKGASFSNGIAKFATGGIVNGPTLFPFADGGAMQMGLMGEAGPEAIMPLQRGADGSLGVRAAMGGNGMGGSSSPILNMSFETSTINGVEYVSRDQLEAAMAQTRRQASRDGANKGMAMTLDKIQQSPQTRRRIGM